MGVQETIMRSAIADITSLKKRGLGYGIFNTNFGIAIFLGSFLLGALYDQSVKKVIAAVLVLETIALVLFFVMVKNLKRKEDF